MSRKVGLIVLGVALAIAAVVCLSISSTSGHDARVNDAACTMGFSTCRDDIDDGSGLKVAAAVLGGLALVSLITGAVLPQLRRCPACQSTIDQRATVCRHCREPLPA